MKLTFTTKNQGKFISRGDMKEKEMIELKARIESLEEQINQIKETLDTAFEGEQAKWQQVFEAVDMNFKEIRDYANDTFLHADTFWEIHDKNKLN
ncbi:MAG: hypothetical protein CM15mP86_12400 [Gammaproteobacteria bacterium]|nr:MAG: hypothetical protein CM15mP86_12400 [Gammaproteobacteria bacterium]